MVKFSLASLAVAVLLLIIAYLAFFEPIPVKGSSMEPTYVDGDYVLFEKVSVYLNRVQPGDVIAFHYPLDPSIRLVKRVEVVEDGRFFVVGDNAAESSDSREWGPVDRSLLIGKAIWKY